ncbi:MAG: COQ9 family protein [Candidatus Saccharibacteria bacterium]|nr:COQ9 family protein [Pseudorhodobacter sp.]
MDDKMTMETTKSRLLEAALPHVPFDGWSEATLAAAITDSQTAPALARALFPRGGLDLALAYHAAGDQQLRATIAATDMAALRFRDRFATAVRLRLQLADRECVRRGAALFPLPQNVAAGSRVMWATADTIWTALGDTSTDVNWYTKRVSASGVYAATVLFWLGDDSANQQATWEFLDRRVDNVMSIEATKARFRENRLGKALMAGPLKILERVHAPRKATDLPGKV